MGRFKDNELEKLKNANIFLCSCATGKTWLAKHDARFVDIDMEEAIYKYDLDQHISYDDFTKKQGHSVVVRTDSGSYIHARLLEHLANGKIILSASHRHIYEFLHSENLPYVYIQYSEKEIPAFSERMRKRGNTEDFIDAMLGYRGVSTLKQKIMQDATVVIDIYGNEYLSDLMWEIFGIPNNLKEK